MEVCVSFFFFFLLFFLFSPFSSSFLAKYRVIYYRIIASALGHDPSFRHTVFSSSSISSSLSSLEEKQAPVPQTKVQDCIVEAELLVYNEAQSRIEQFGSVRELQDAEHSSDERVEYVSLLFNHMYHGLIHTSFLTFFFFF